MISPLTRSHVLLLVPCPAFAFLMVRWWGKKRAVAPWRGRRRWVSSMMPAVFSQQCHPRKPRQISVKVDSGLTLARRGWTLFLILKQVPAARCTLFPLKLLLFYIPALFCSCFLHLTQLQYIHSILTGGPSEWPVDGVKSQLAHNLCSLMMDQQQSTVSCPAAKLWNRNTTENIKKSWGDQRCWAALISCLCPSWPGNKLCLHSALDCPVKENWHEAISDQPRNVKKQWS